jgi:hypothetical protein
MFDFSYFTDYRYFLPQNLNLFYLLAALLFGNLCATSIYFFSKNKLGSILISAPISAVYLFGTLRNSLHIYHFIFVILFQYVIVWVIEKYKAVN